MATFQRSAQTNTEFSNPKDEFGKLGCLLRNLKDRPISSFVLRFGVCVRLLLSAFH